MKPFIETLYASELVDEDPGIFHVTRKLKQLANRLIHYSLTSVVFTMCLLVFLMKLRRKGFKSATFPHTVIPKEFELQDLSSACTCSKPSKPGAKTPTCSAFTKPQAKVTSQNSDKLQTLANETRSSVESTVETISESALSESGIESDAENLKSCASSDDVVATPVVSKSRTSDTVVASGNEPTSPVVSTSNKSDTDKTSQNEVTPPVVLNSKHTDIVSASGKEVLVTTPVVSKPRKSDVVLASRKKITSPIVSESKKSDIVTSSAVKEVTQSIVSESKKFDIVTVSRNEVASPIVSESKKSDIVTVSRNEVASPIVSDSKKLDNVTSSVKEVSLPIASKKLDIVKASGNERLSPVVSKFEVSSPRNGIISPSNNSISRTTEAAVTKETCVPSSSPVIVNKTPKPFPKRKRVDAIILARSFNYGWYTNTAEVDKYRVTEEDIKNSEAKSPVDTLATSRGSVAKAEAAEHAHASTGLVADTTESSIENSVLASPDVTKTPETASSPDTLSSSLALTPETSSTSGADVKASKVVRKLLPKIPDQADIATMDSKSDTKNQQPAVSTAGFGQLHLEYVLMAEYNSMHKHSIPGVYTIPSALTPLIWHCVIFVRQGLYKGAIFKFNLNIPDTYPNGESPQVFFEQPVFHPLVDLKTGELDVKREFQKWRRNVHYIWQVLMYTRKVFFKIDTKSPWQPEAAQLYEQNMELFKEKVNENISDSQKKAHTRVDCHDPHVIEFKPWDHCVHDDARDLMLCGKRSRDGRPREGKGLSWMSPKGVEVFLLDD